jgi:hypothetical protein
MDHYALDLIAKLEGLAIKTQIPIIGTMYAYREQNMMKPSKLITVEPRFQ